MIYVSEIRGEAASAGGAHGGGDAVDGEMQRLAEGGLGVRVTSLPSLQGAEAAEEAHLDVGQGIHVGIAQDQGLLQGRIAVQEFRLAGDAPPL